MMNRFFLLVLTAAILQACSSNSGNTSSEIDIAGLDSLQTEVVLEIGESEDYLPGQLTSFVVAPSGDFLVADWASNTIEQFDNDGNHMGTIAKGGKGPGEMGNYFTFSDTGNDTLLVNQIVTSQRDYFVPGPDGLYRFVRSDKQASRPERSFTIIGAQSDTSYYATVGGFFSFDESSKKDYESSEMVVVNSSGKMLQDSVQTYKTANLYVVRTDNSINAQSIPYRYDDDLSILKNGNYLIARIDSNAIYKYNSKHQLEKKIPLNVADRPLSSDDLQNELGEMDAKTRNAIEARVSDIKPPFLSVMGTEDYIWLHTNTSEKGKEMVVIDYDGNAIGKFMLLESDAIQDIEKNRIYTIHHSPERGDLIRVYRVDI